MQKRRSWRYLLGAPLLAIAVVGDASLATAMTSSSSHYQVSETQFGVGTTQESCSVKYCAKASIGDLSAGGSKSSAGSATFGSITPEEPLLEVIIEQGQSNLGVLKTESTATKTMIVKVRNYLSNGYILQINGSAPKFDGHSLKTLSTPTASQPGVEQFALNAVANTTPVVGANPVQVPDAQTSFGIVEADYRSPNLFKFKSGDIVARSRSESGRTDYTISMIVNISNATPAGHYASDFSAVVVPLY